MALGGGTFTSQNKVLPGTYINFVSTSNATATLSDRGYATMGLELDWGVENEIFEVTNSDFQKNSLTLFGYDYSNDKLKGLRDLFINLKVLYAYRLNGGTKASCDFGTAKYTGTRGNDLRITISKNSENNEIYDVSTILDNSVVDTQTVASYLDLVDNDYITFDKKYVVAEPDEAPEFELDDELNNGSSDSYDDEFNNGSSDSYDDEFNNGSSDSYDDEFNNGSSDSYDDELNNGSSDSYDDEFNNSSSDSYEDELNNGLSDSYDDELNNITGFSFNNISSFSLDDSFNSGSSDSLDIGLSDEIEETQPVYVARELYEVIAMPLIGGTSEVATTTGYQKYLDKAESFSYNIIGVITDDNTIKQLYSNFTKRMRDEVGVKFQLVVHDYNADYEGVINVKNAIQDESYPISSLVYYVAGLQASCEVNKSCLNKTYAGEFKIDCDYNQSELEQAIKSGEFAYHNVGYDVKVLNDINSLVSLEEDTGEIFQENQTIRVIDQFATDIAYLFNTKYLGVVGNTQSGRVSLWTDIVKYCKELQQLGAIEDFSSNDIEVFEGDSKKSVVVSSALTVVNAMAQLYMSVTIE